MATNTARGFIKPEANDAYDIDEMVGDNMDLIDAEFDGVVERFSGSDSFDGGGTTETVTNPNITENSLVTIVITDSTRPQGIWIVDSNDGNFVITSTRPETESIDYDYYVDIIK